MQGFDHNMRGTLNVPVAGNDYYSTNILMIFENSLNMCVILLNERRSINCDYVDQHKFMSSNKCIIIVHSGMHYDSIISKRFISFDSPLPELHLHNAFLNDIAEKLCTQCLMKSWTCDHKLGYILCDYFIHSG